MIKIAIILLYQKSKITDLSFFQVKAILKLTLSQLQQSNSFYMMRLRKHIHRLQLQYFILHIQ